MNRARAASFMRSMRGPLAMVALYLLVRAAFASVADGDGLITPGGTVDPKVAALGVAVLFLRLVALFVVPGIVVYRLVVALCERDPHI